MPEYNGHASWNQWNVALWIANDEGLYRLALHCIEETRRLCGGDEATHIEKATLLLMSFLEGERTPDGGVYNRLSVKRALAGLME